MRGKFRQTEGFSAGRPRGPKRDARAGKTGKPAPPRDGKVAAKAKKPASAPAPAPAVEPAIGVRIVAVPEDRDGQRLDNFLFGLLKGVPKTHVYRLLRTGQVRIS